MLIPITDIAPNPLIQIVNEVKIEEEIKETPKKKVTWRDNPNNCNEDTQYIAKEKPFYCIEKPKPTQTPTSAVNTARTAQKQSSGWSAPAGWYEAGSCTYGAQQLAPWIGRYGNANTWDDMARAEGRTVSSKPVVGAVFVDNGGSYGHVGVVIAVDGNQVTVKDMNYRAKWQWTVRTVPTSSFVYIHP